MAWPVCVASPATTERRAIRCVLTTYWLTAAPLATFNLPDRAGLALARAARRRPSCSDQ